MKRKKNGAQDFRTCESDEANSANLLLARARCIYLNSKIKGWTWIQNFVRPRVDYLEDVTVYKGVDGSVYLETGSNTIVRTLPTLDRTSTPNSPSVDLQRDVLKRTQKCDLFRSEECRHVSTLIHDYEYSNEHVQQLSKHLCLQHVPKQNYYVYMKKYDITPLVQINNADVDWIAKQGLSEVLSTTTITSGKHIHTVIDSPFMCWFDVTINGVNERFSIKQNEIRLTDDWKSSLSLKRCKETFLYVDGQFFCASKKAPRETDDVRDFTRLAPYDPVIGIWADTITDTYASAFIMDTITDALKNFKQFTIADLVKQTFELHLQYLHAIGDSETNDDIHELFETMSGRAKFFRGSSVRGVSLLDVIYDEENKTLLAEIQKADPDDQVENIITSFANSIGNDGWEVETPHWSYHIPDTMYIPVNAGQQVHKVSIRSRVFVTRTQCCLNIERGRSTCRFTGYDEAKHGMLKRSMHVDGTLELESNDSTLRVTAPTSFLEIQRIVDTFESFDMTFQEDSLHYTVTYVPRIIPDRCESIEDNFGWLRRKSVELSPIETGMRMASIHPDMICFQLLVQDSAGLRLRKSLNHLKVVENAWNSGALWEVGGFSAMFIQFADLLSVWAQSILNAFGLPIDPTSITEMLLEGLSGLFDKFISAIQDMGAGQGLGVFWQNLMSPTEERGLLDGIVHDWGKFCTLNPDAGWMDNLRDKAVDTALEGAKGAVDVSASMSNIPDMILDFFQNIPFFEKYIDEARDFIESILSMILNPIQMFFLYSKMKRMFMNWYIKYDHDRMQNVQQHSETYSAFVRYVAENESAVVKLSAMRLTDLATPYYNASVLEALKVELSRALYTWANTMQSPHTAIVRIYYKETGHRCYIHSRRRCPECSKQKMKLCDAVNTLSQAVFRYTEWDRNIQ